MLSERDKEIVLRFKHELEKRMRIIDFRVYGSRARGDNTADSDIDVFIELEEITPELRQRISEIAWKVGFEMDRVISTFVATKTQIANGPLGANPIIDKIEKEGLPL